MTTKLTPLVLDVDPGHDDFMLLISSLFSQYHNILGISTVGGNQSLEKVTINALNTLNIFTNENVFNKDDNTDIKMVDFSQIPVVPGAEHSLLHDNILCPEIHGESGLETTDKEFVWPPLRNKAIEGIHSVNYFAEKITKYALENDEKVHIIATGRLTNIALLLTMYPHITKYIAQITIMGGSYKEGGNTGRSAEFNIQIDPEGAHVVFSYGASRDEITILQTEQSTPSTTTLKKVPIVLIPLDVTHTVLVTPDVLNRINAICLDVDNKTSVFGKLLNDLLMFFANTYRDYFGFRAGPPLHDPVTFFYLSCVQHNKSNNTMITKDPKIAPIDPCNSELIPLPPHFTTLHAYVEVDTSNSICRGTTVVDAHGLCKRTENIIIATSVDVEAFWNHFLHNIERANRQCILNKKSQ
jgi:inosine-uridine nucleoside N-ribohydrolase